MKIAIKQRGARWYLNFRVPWGQTPEGKPKYKRFNWSVGEYKKDAETARDTTMKAILNGSFDGTKPWIKAPEPERETKTFGDLCDEYLETIAHRAKSTQATARYQLGTLRAKIGNDTPVESITSRNCETLLAELVKRYQGTYTNNLLAMLTRVLDRAVKWGYVSTNPATGWERQDARDREVYLEPAEVDAILAQCDRHREWTWMRPIIEVLLHTGARPGEWLGDRYGRPPLTWEKVDLKKRQVELKTRKHRHRQWKTRIVPLNDEAHKVLSALHRRGGWGPVFRDNDGEPPHTQRVLKTFQRIVAAARIKKDLPVRLYDCRHSCASWLVQRRIPLYLVSKILGHSNPRTTERYSHVEVEHLRGAVAVLGDGTKMEPPASEFS